MQTPSGRTDFLLGLEGTQGTWGDFGGLWLWLWFSHLNRTQSCLAAWAWNVDQRPGASRWIGSGLEERRLLSAVGLSRPLLTRTLHAHRVFPSTGLAMDCIAALPKFLC